MCEWVKLGMPWEKRSPNITVPIGYPPLNSWSAPIGRLRQSRMIKITRSTRIGPSQVHRCRVDRMRLAALSIVDVLIIDKGGGDVKPPNPSPAQRVSPQARAA